MNFVYILQSEKNGRYYIGSTENVERRLVEHNSGKTASLRYLIPMRLVFKQEFENSIMAKRMERKLKNAKSKSILERIIADGFIKMGL